MGNKGARKKGSFARDYANHVMWNTYINLSDTDLEGIAGVGHIILDAKTNPNLRNKMESCAAMAESEKAAPPVGGIFPSLDFFNKHVQRLAEIYEAVGETVSQVRRKLSRKNLSSIAGSDFLNFYLVVNALLPDEI